MSKKSALVVIDVQVEAVKDVFNGDLVLDNINTLLARARGSGTPVVYVQHTNVPATLFTRPLCNTSWSSVGSTIWSW